MELLLTVLLLLWQLGWVLLLGGALWALLCCIPALRKRKVGTFLACVLAVCLLLSALCVRPMVIGADADEKAEVRQLAAGPYSRRMPMVTPVCAVVEDTTGGMEVQVWYAFVGSMTYEQDGDGWSIIQWLFPWN